MTRQSAIDLATAKLDSGELFETLSRRIAYWNSILQPDSPAHLYTSMLRHKEISETGIGRSGIFLLSTTPIFW